MKSSLFFVHCGMLVNLVAECTTRYQGPVNLRVESLPLDRTEARADKFTEQQAFWNVPLHETNIISDLAVSQGKCFVEKNTISSVVESKEVKYIQE